VYYSAPSVPSAAALEGIRKALAFLTALALALSWARDARATPSAKLTYVRGPGAERCPDEATLRQAVADRLGYDLFFPWATKTVVAEIDREKRGYTARIKIVDASGLARGERALRATSEDCGQIVRALALAISIAVDDLDLDRAPPPPPASSPTPPPPAAPPPEPVPEVPPPPPPAPPPKLPPDVPPRRERRGFAFEAWVAPTVSSGVAPKASVGGVVAVGGRYRFLSLDVEARADAPATGGTTQAGAVTTTIDAGAVAGCLHAPAPLFLCATGLLGTFFAEGHDVAAPKSVQAPYRAVGGRIGLEVPIVWHLYFLAQADALANLTRHTVQVSGEDTYTLGAGSLSVGAGVGVLF
jgi:hypothetical protein